MSPGRAARALARALALALAPTLGTGCEEITRRMDLERMTVQPRLDAFEPLPPALEHEPLRQPPAGTVPRQSTLREVAFDAMEIPIAVDEALLRRGREQFERLCAACHGVLGEGNPGVAPHMVLRPPPSLHEPRIQAQPPGTLYHTIRDGFGLMPGYARWLDDRDRWAVITHLQVLWTSQAVRLADLPPQWARRARAELEP